MTQGADGGTRPGPSEILSCSRSSSWSGPLGDGGRGETEQERVIDRVVGPLAVWVEPTHSERLRGSRFSARCSQQRVSQSLGSFLQGEPRSSTVIWHRPLLLRCSKSHSS